MGLGLLSSPVTSTVDLGAAKPLGPGSGGKGIVATNNSAAVTQLELSPDMASASTPSPSAASLVCLSPLHSASVQASLHLLAEQPSRRCPLSSPTHVM